MDDATLGGDSPGCVDVIARHHPHGDARTLTLADSLGHLAGEQRQRLKTLSGNTLCNNRVCPLLRAASVQQCVMSYLRSHGILDADHSDAGQLGHYLGLVVPFWLRIGRQVTVRNADCPQALARHWLNHLVLIYRSILLVKPFNLFKLIISGLIF